MPDYSSNFVTANGIKQHYYRAEPAGGVMPVVLLHGLTDNGMCWVRVADALCGRYDVIMPDTRGHGRSDKPAGGYDLETRAADIAALIDALGLDRPVLMGHSLGGQAATAIAALYPGKVRGIILEDPAWFLGLAPLEQRRANNRGWAEDLRRNQSTPVDELAAQCREQNPTWHPDECPPWAVAKHEMSPEALEAILLATGGATWREELPKVECPVLLLRAEPERGAIITTEMAEEAASLWKTGRTVQITGAGHCIHREQFEPVMAEVLAFLRELE